ncbi:MAG TPA: hypothetical protein VD887_13635 [Allosphingosinicella sp.]|nr:hypothetical protein [Allosphingosinicella sp.]HYG31242.1 hypothetical protein [Allosphingosinicella sp.]
MAKDGHASRRTRAAPALPPEPDPIARALQGIRELQQTYLLERMIFIAGGFLSLLFATGVGIFMMVVREPTLASMLPLLGSGGVFMATGSGAMFYFGKSFDLLRELALATRHG